MYHTDGNTTVTSGSLRNLITTYPKVSYLHKKPPYYDKFLYSYYDFHLLR